MLHTLLKNRSLWEAPLLDLWTIPHTLSGVLIAYGALLLGIDFWTGLLISFAIATLWEVFEVITRISDAEHHTNGASDIFVAQVGYCVGIWALSTEFGTSIDTLVITIVAIIFATLCVLGWLSHHWYGK